MKDFNEALEPVLRKDARYSRDAYHFVREALDHTQQLHQKKSQRKSRHVSGPELLDGIRDLALRQYGPMAITVLDDWGIRHCADFGEIVFNLVEHRILDKTEHDSREDFKKGFDFAEAFRLPFLPSAKAPAPGKN